MDGNSKIISKGEYVVTEGVANMTDTNGIETRANIPEYGTLIWSIGDGDIIFSLL